MVSDSARPDAAQAWLWAAIVIRVAEDACEVIDGDRVRTVPFVTLFPSPRVERVSPGHLVAVGAAADGTDVVVWRWYDAVVLGVEGDLIRMWEPAHGEVLAQPRLVAHPPVIGSRAYLSAGLPGAQWWVAGPVVTDAAAADVEFDEVERLFAGHELRAQTTDRIR